MVAYPVIATPALSMLIAALLLGVVLGGLAAWAWAPPRRRLPPLPTQWTLASRRVLNADERHVYNQLRLAFPSYIVMPKLPLVRLCQSATPDQVQFWYQLIGAAHVTFAVCNPNGHVLLVIDLDSTRIHSRRSTWIKESVLAACGIQRLHCTANALPSIDELRSLMNDQGLDGRVSEAISDPLMAPVGEPLTPPANSPDTQPGQATPRTVATPDTPENSTAVAPYANRPATWRDPSVFLDSFFTSDDRAGSVSASESQAELVNLSPVSGQSAHADGATVTDAGVSWPGAPVRVANGR
ncbi:MAG: DUF2726 domain-containing protein [Burkholderiales bacterium]